MLRFMKLIVGISIILIITMIAITPAFADTELDLITDYAKLLSHDEYLEINHRASEISEKYQCDIAIITVDEMEYDDVYDFADAVIDEYDMGYGDQGSILLLFLNMGNRDFTLIARGYGNIAFTDYGKEVILDKHVLPLLKDKNYHGAFLKYLSVSEEYLKMAKSGAAFDKKTDPNYGKVSLPIKLGITFLIPIIIATIICGIWKGKMKTARLARTAGNYIGAEGLILTNQQDQFLYRTETRRRIENKSPSGGSSVGSSGSSGRAGKF